MQPIIFEIGPFALRYYGLMYAIALISGIFIIKHTLNIKQIVIDQDLLLDFIIYGFLAAIIGARLYYVIFNLDFYLSRPAEIIAIWHGGLAIHGGIIGAFLFGYLFADKHQLPKKELADSCSMAAILGQSIGRLGNFFNGDAFGLPTKMPWGITFPLDSPAGQAFPGQATHPVMFYESVANLIAFLLLYFYYKKYQPRSGVITALYIIAYSIIRFFVSFYRADSLMFFELRAAHLISMIGIIIGFWLLRSFKKS
jgi:phosphatidylglycerol:prolipoprotein diacylglycerol transferase